MKIKTYTTYTINYNSDECSDDVIDRFMKEHKLKKIVKVKIAGLCEQVYYRSNGYNYFILSKLCVMNNDMSGGTVEFIIGRA